MNKYTAVFLACLAFSSVHGVHDDPEFDFIEKMVHDGKYPEHFFEKEKQVAPLYDQEDALYQTLVQRPSVLAKDCPDDICKFPHIPKIVIRTKAILSKNRAIKKVLSVAMKAVKKAMKVTRKLVGAKAHAFPKDPKQMVKNAMYLKAFAMLNADKLYSRASHLGSLGGLLQDMSTSSKKTPLQQYADSMERISGLTDNGGLGLYTLKAVALAMLGKGLVSIGPIGSKGTTRQFVKIDSSDIGLVRQFPVLTQLATTVGFFTRTLKILDKKAVFALKGRGRAEPPLTEKDFKRLFRTTCFGAGKNYGVCLKHKTKATCHKRMSQGCNWLGAWDGRLAEQVQLGTSTLRTAPGSIGAWGSAWVTV